MHRLLLVGMGVSRTAYERTLLAAAGSPVTFCLFLLSASRE